MHGPLDCYGDCNCRDWVFIATGVITGIVITGTVTTGTVCEYHYSSKF